MPECLTHRLGRLGAALVFFVLLVPMAARAEPVRVGCVEFPPLTYTDADGRAAGKAIALVSHILERAGLDFEIKCYPGARLMANLRDGSAHVAMLIRHPDILDSVQYGHLPMAYLKLNAYRLASAPPLGRIENVRGRSLILLRGYGYSGWIDFFKDPTNRVTLSFADSREAAFRMLVSGHGEYLIDYADPASLVLAYSPLKGLQSETLVRLETYFLVSNKAPNPPALLWRIEDAFTRMGARPLQ